MFPEIANQAFALGRTVQRECPSASNIHVANLGSFGVVEMTDLFPLYERAEGYSVALRVKTDAAGNFAEVLGSQFQSGSFSTAVLCESSWVDAAVRESGLISMQRLSLTNARNAIASGGRVASLLENTHPQSARSTVAPAVERRSLLPVEEFLIRIPLEILGRTKEGRILRHSLNMDLPMAAALWSTAVARAPARLGTENFEVEIELRAEPRPAKTVGTVRHQPLRIHLAVKGPDARKTELEAWAAADVILDNGRGVISQALLIDNPENPGLLRTLPAAVQLSATPELSSLSLFLGELWLPALDR